MTQCSNPGLRNHITRSSGRIIWYPKRAFRMHNSRYAHDNLNKTLWCFQHTSIWRNFWRMSTAEFCMSKHVAPCQYPWRENKMAPFVKIFGQKYTVNGGLWEELLLWLLPAPWPMTSGLPSVTCWLTMCGWRASVTNKSEFSLSWSAVRAPDLNEILRALSATSEFPA